jgi:hypothetical protein
MLLGAALVAGGLSGTALAGGRSARAASDPFCTGDYAGAPARAGAPVRFGVDPGIAGSAGGVQLPTVPDNPARDLSAALRLRPEGRVLVVRLNRLFWSDGQAGIDRFKRMTARYTRAGFEVELQVRYHPNPSDAGNIAAWVRYVRHVVDSFGANPRVVAMTITNEVNVTTSPNTSDGYYPRAEDALIDGIEAAHREAVRRHYRQLRFGFTYAYRFAPNQDAAFFAYLRTHGASAFTRALGFVGLDFYPGTIYPPAMAPSASYRAAFAQAAGVVRDCLAPMAGIGRRVPIWVTENGVPSGTTWDADQALALKDLVRAVHDYSRTFNITDYRWFNLRDSNSSSPATSGPTFSTDGLLRSNYTRKPSFAVYRSLIATYGTRSPGRDKRGQGLCLEGLNRRRCVSPAATPRALPPARIAAPRGTAPRSRAPCRPPTGS